MSGFLTERQLDDKVDLPLSLPITELAPGDSIILGVLQLTNNKQKLSHRFAQVRIIHRDPATPTTPGKIDATKGFAYVAIFNSAGTEINGTATIADAVDLAESALPVSGGRTAPVTPIVGPSSGVDEYTFRVINNCSDVTLQVAVSAMWRLDLNS